jgi:hypothetical protein
LMAIPREAPGNFHHPKCMCGYVYEYEGEWCPRCWRDRRPKEEQLKLFKEKKK